MPTHTAHRHLGIGCPRRQRSVTSRPPSPTPAPCTAVRCCRGPLTLPAREALCARPQLLAVTVRDSGAAAAVPGPVPTAWLRGREVAAPFQHSSAQHRSAAPPARGSSGIFRCQSHRVDPRCPRTFPADALPGTCAVTRCEDAGHRRLSLLPFYHPNCAAAQRLRLLPRGQRRARVPSSPTTRKNKGHKRAFK